MATYFEQPSYIYIYIYVYILKIINEDRSRNKWSMFSTEKDKCKLRVNIGIKGQRNV